MNKQNPTSVNLYKNMQHNVCNRPNQNNMHTRSSLNGLPITQGQKSQNSINSNESPKKYLQNLKSFERDHVNHASPQNPQPFFKNVDNRNSNDYNTTASYREQYPVPNYNIRNRNFNSTTDEKNTMRINPNIQDKVHSSTSLNERSRTPQRLNRESLTMQGKTPVKRSKSPLKVFIMPDQKEKNTSRPSVNAKPLSKEERLERMIIMRDAEISELRKEIEHLKNNEQNVNTYSNPDEFERTKENYGQLKDELEALQVENRKLKETLVNQEQDFNKQLFNIKLKYEENARKNLEIMQEELVFQYANNDQEATKILKEKLKQIEQH